MNYCYLIKIRKLRFKIEKVSITRKIKFKKVIRRDHTDIIRLNNNLILLIHHKNLTKFAKN